MEKYDHKNIETRLYQQWEEDDLFSPDEIDSEESYSIVIPPPNVTGSLHIGHALVNTLQDILIRWQRMQGKKTLWLPGTDHAGIATQFIVEKDLRKQNIKKEEIGREQLLEKIWDWKERHSKIIYGQLKRLGASLDWKRERFTLDEGLSKAVKRAFKEYYDQGLIYQGEYLVNWCPEDKTALSDLEVEYKTVQGELTSIKYYIEESDEFLVVATTRAETLLGDTAIAVHPDDQRYQKFHGKNAIVPLVNRKVPIITDSLCDIEFGTGVLKVTPAHDQNDFLMGKKHHLDFINIFTEDAKINDIYSQLQGFDRFEARKKIKELLKEIGQLVETKSFEHNVGHSQRQGVPIEPRISKQWFCKMDDMAKSVIKEIEKGAIKITPPNQQKICLNWLNNIQDWCISRQLWWGHAIPAWHCLDCQKITVSEENSISTCEHCHSKNIQQDPDVLDTWFSSGLFPFSTMGWPEKTNDLALFYPNATLVTAYDILFFWVARMLMMGKSLTGQNPFPEVFTHGLVRDQQGRKMSKTLGNVIDPLELIDQYGADALRFTLCSLTVMGRDVKLDTSAIAGSQKFVNKLWNAAQFVMIHLETHKPQAIEELDDLNIFDDWILYHLDVAISETEDTLKKYRFHEYSKNLYSFVWNIFCDWYLEVAKPTLFSDDIKQKEKTISILFHLLTQILRLLHPVIPFATEAIWQNMPLCDGSLMRSPFPRKQALKQNDQTMRAEQIIQFVNVIRNLRGENDFKPHEKIEVLLNSKNEVFLKDLDAYLYLIQPLAKINKINFVDELNIPANGIVHSSSLFRCIIEASEDKMIDREKLLQQQHKLNQDIDALTAKLENNDFLDKAPQNIIIKNQNRLHEMNLALEKILIQLQSN